MKKSKFLILMTVVLLILICLAIFVQNNKTDTTDEISNTDAIVANQSNIEVTNYTKEQLKSIQITEGENSLTFIQDGENWSIEGVNTSDNLNTAAIKVLCDNLLTLDASQKIDATNLEDFGLKAPSKIVTYTLTDGATSRILFGNVTPNHKNVYILKESTNEIFLITVSMADSFSGDLTKFRTTELETIDTSTVTALKASGKDIETFDISLNADTQEYTTSYLLQLSDGSIRDMSTNNFLELLKLIPSPITIEHFVADNVTDLTPYGLDVPTLDLYLQNTTTDTTSGESKDVVTEIHYLWGNTTEDGQIYFMKADTQSIYSMNSDFLAPLLEAFDPFYLSAKFIQLTNIAEVMQIDIVLPDSSYTLKIDGENYTLNDQTLPTDTFKSIYKNIIGISADTELKGATLPTKAPIITFTFTSPEGEKTTYNYYNYDNQFYQTQFKGQSIVGCSIKQFNYLKECLDKALAE
nr:DUF4340 domain-containing protein [uncultured Cellulosilyticum sp.]